jgi:hypothetical protein
MSNEIVQNINKKAVEMLSVRWLILLPYLELFRLFLKNVQKSLDGFYQ